MLRSRLYHCWMLPSSIFPTANSAIACYVLFAHRQPSGTKFSTRGKRHDTAVARRARNGFPLATWGGGFYKTHCGKNSTVQLASASPEQVKTSEILVPISYLLPFEHHTGTSNQCSFWAHHSWNHQLLMQGQHKTHHDFSSPQEILQEGWSPSDTHFILHSSLFLHLRSWRKNIATRKSWTH